MPIRQVLTDGPLPVKIWASEIDDNATQQLRNLARLPFIFKHVAAMPDAHWGMGATVGSVIATKGAIIPAAVGVDIGCGMMAVQTTLDARRVRDKAVGIRAGIEATIPVGFEGHKSISKEAESWTGWASWAWDLPLSRKALAQLGSLGGGNHFIEVCADDDEKVWLLLHSGSRNVGKTIADRHINAAKGLMKRWFIDLPDPDLAYVVEGTPEFDDYLRDLLWCQNYAAENRRQMMAQLVALLSKAFGPLGPGLVVNCHHNYAEREHHFDSNVWVTRKGAVRARKGDYGIVPGSMGARSYIVRGLGCDDSFHSCAHGAGRRMGRKEAERRFTVDDLANQTAGVECRKDAGVLDEIPAAYKDIEQVMADQSDLVEVVARLKQILCVKG